MIHIADLTFGIANAQLDLLLDDDLMTWGFTVNGETLDDGPSDWRAPLVDSAGLFQTRLGQLNRWTDLEPKQISWSRIEDNDEIPHAMLYIFEHTLIQECSATIAPLGSRLHLNLAGMCDVYYDVIYGENLEFALSADLVLGPIMCGRSSEEICWQRLSGHLDPGYFAYTQDESGVSMLVPRAQS